MRDRNMVTQDWTTIGDQGSSDWVRKVTQLTNSQAKPFGHSVISCVKATNVSKSAMCIH